MQHVQNIQYGYLLNKCLKCSVWRLAVRYDIYRVFHNFVITAGGDFLSLCDEKKFIYS
jgi:hypothetical protein